MAADLDNGRLASLSIVVPVYRCAECLGQLCARLKACLPALTEKYEILLIDDRSPDNAWSIILELQRLHPEVKGIRLSRNFGQQIAISAGLAAARGAYALVMDGDLQDPPEKIPDFVAEIRKGHDLVLARRARRSHSWLRVRAAEAYFAILGWLTNRKIDGNYSPFSMLSRKVIDAFLRVNERERHYIFILHWLGFNAGVIDYDHGERATGESSYSLEMLLRHAVDGILFQDTTFLRWIMGVGLLFGLLGCILALAFIYLFFSHGSVPGWTSVVVLMLVCTGVLLLSVGVVGLYVGKIFDQVKQRPLYVVDAESENPLPW